MACYTKAAAVQWRTIHSAVNISTLLATDHCTGSAVRQEQLLVKWSLRSRSAKYQLLKLQFAGMGMFAQEQTSRLRVHRPVASGQSSIKISILRIDLMLACFYAHNALLTECGVSDREMEKRNNWLLYRKLELPVRGITLETIQSCGY